MKLMIVQTLSGQDVYVNPEHVETIEADMAGCHLNMISGDCYALSGDAHTIASLLCGNPTDVESTSDKYYGYK